MYISIHIYSQKLKIKSSFIATKKDRIYIFNMNLRQKFRGQKIGGYKIRLEKVEQKVWTDFLQSEKKVLANLSNVESDKKSENINYSIHKIKILFFFINTQLFW